LSLPFSPSTRRPPTSPRFPYTTLFRSHPPHLQRRLGEADHARRADRVRRQHAAGRVHRQITAQARDALLDQPPPLAALGEPEALDRKSTRLNSSHVKISYAVFCLKKKN